MRILLVGDYPSDARLGSAKVYVKLQEEFERLGHECRVMLGDDIGAPRVKGRVRWALGPAIAARAIGDECTRSGPYDVIDVASAEAMVLALRRRASATAIVNRSHGLEHLNYARMLNDHAAGLTSKPFYRRLWYPLVRLSQVAAAAKWSDRLIVLNESERTFVLDQAWKRPGEIDVIPHGVSADLIADACPVGERSGILFCGSWDAVKGTSYLVDAFERIAAESPRVGLTILGPGRVEAEVLSAFPDSIRGRVRVVPRVSEAEVFEHYRRHEVLMVSSTYEGFGLVILEAMSQGLPVVATAVGGAPALLQDGTCGRLVPTRSAQALSEAALSLLADERLRADLGRAAFHRARTQTWTATALRTVACYDLAIGAKQ